MHHLRGLRGRPRTVVEVHGASALVEVEGGRQQVAVELVEPVSAGEILLCHAGIAIRKVAQ